jgi:Viral BACON domain
VTVADRTVTVSQAASCNLDLTPASVTHGAEAQSQSLAVATGPTCAWSASSNAPWLLLTNTTGIGPGGVGYSLPVNRGPQRTGNITVSRTGAAATSTVTQLSGCTYTLTADQGSPPPRFVDITTSDPACRWTLRLSDPWLNVNGPTTFTGSGTTRVPLNVEFDCSKGFRSATVELFGEDGTKRGQVTITQTISCTIILAQG